jgi:hypothetical protein
VRHNVDRVVRASGRVLNGKDWERVQGRGNSMFYVDFKLETNATVTTAMWAGTESG